MSPTLVIPFAMCLCALCACGSTSSRDAAAREALERMRSYSGPPPDPYCPPATFCLPLPAVVRLEWLSAEECAKSGGDGKNPCYRYVKILSSDERRQYMEAVSGQESEKGDITNDGSGQKTAK